MSCLLIGERPNYRRLRKIALLLIPPNLYSLSDSGRTTWREVLVGGYSWGRYFKGSQKALSVYWADERCWQADERGSLLPHGAGHSFGDLGLNSSGTLLKAGALKRILALDKERQLLRVGAGATLGDLSRVLLPAGLFFQTCPNSTRITVGGAIAADAHGRNHFSKGSFGSYVTQFELIRSNGDRLLCSPDSNSDLYRATIGGLGLTGLISWAEIKVRGISSTFIDGTLEKFTSLEFGLAQMEALYAEYEYVSAWVDLYSEEPKGILVAGNHSTKGGIEPDCASRFGPKFSVPFAPPRCTINRVGMKIFNRLYFARQKEGAFRAPLLNFLFTLDQLDNWNRLFGSKGFLHFHFLLPSPFTASLKQLLREIHSSGECSALSVMKRFGPSDSGGVLSFPKEGVMVATDFKYRGQSTIESFRRWERTVAEAGGRLYLAKDSVMTKETFQATYPSWIQFREQKDVRFSSDLWRRLT